VSRRKRDWGIARQKILKIQEESTRSLHLEQVSGNTKEVDEEERRGGIHLVAFRPLHLRRTHPAFGRSFCRVHQNEGKKKVEARKGRREEEKKGVVSIHTIFHAGCSYGGAWKIPTGEEKNWKGVRPLERVFLGLPISVRIELKLEVGKGKKKKRTSQFICHRFQKKGPNFRVK